jgi:beta-phosphoglucomutase-like phosphatase (HAD superfamily)
MKVFVQQLATGLFLKTETEWVKLQTDAHAFVNSREAIGFCRGRSMPDVRLLVSFENAEHNFYLHPFGNNELGATTQRLLAEHMRLQEEQLALVSGLEHAITELKQQRKQLETGTERHEKRISGGVPVQSS